MREIESRIKDLVNASISGDNEATTKLLLYSVNSVSNAWEIDFVIKNIGHFYDKWSNSKKYLYCRLLLRSERFREAFKKLEKLCVVGYAPALCKLGTIYIHEMHGTNNHKEGLSYLERASKEGHYIAKRNICIWRAKQSSWIVKIYLHARGFYFYLVWRYVKKALY